MWSRNAFMGKKLRNLDTRLTYKQYSAIASILEKANVGEITEIKVISFSFSISALKVRI